MQRPTPTRNWNCRYACPTATAIYTAYRYSIAVPPVAQGPRARLRTTLVFTVVQRRRRRRETERTSARVQFSIVCIPFYRTAVCSAGGRGSGSGLGAVRLCWWRATARTPYLTRQQHAMRRSLPGTTSQPRHNCADISHVYPAAAAVAGNPSPQDLTSGPGVTLFALWSCFTGPASGSAR